jgi:hypothetical protein
MARRYEVGDKVLASRDETGEDHEPGVVIDSYEVIMGEQRRPIVVVEFEDGERKYMTATTPNVLPVEEEEEEAEEGAEADELDEDEPVEEEGGDEDEELPDAVADAGANGNGAVTFDDGEEGASP